MRGNCSTDVFVYVLFLMCWAVDEGELFNRCVWCMICLCVGLLMRGNCSTYVYGV